MSVASRDVLTETILMWSETYAMQASNGRRKATSTELKLLDTVRSQRSFWEKLDFNCARTANLCSLHIFREGIRPQYDDPHNANGGHFKMKPYTVDSAHLALKTLCVTFLGADFPHDSSVNGVTIAKKAKSCLIKLWIVDSLNQTVINAMNEWFDNNLDHLCGRRLFSPHKYILKTFSKNSFLQQQQGKERQPDPGFGRTPGRQPSDATPAQGVLSSQSLTAYDTLYDLPHPAEVVPSCYTPWPLSFSGYSLSDSETSGSGATPTDPTSPTALEQDLALRYAVSLSHLMSFPRSDPAWAEHTAAAVSLRLENTIRKCNSLCSYPHYAPQTPPAAHAERGPPAFDLDLLG